ncbi:DUF3037 domain-containing protein [Aquabacterium sp. A7-Y]|uniref:DUF3037 domain-containing protein n=1 Tax=Aquabacterium sp. A7-Y TaxID=1349605 RepID=UPI00223D1435|nr:DUF3037 domain-containing protein [Aquabacterium sp. A7-Y]MCW7539492.1 DUF3037 domain-containing protein [Aquabacterium sp. A7-Y]
MNASPKLRLRYDYAIVRVVPRVERGEFMNVGAVVCCPQAKFLALEYECDRERLRALDPALDLETLEAALAGLRLQCAKNGRDPTRSLRQSFDFLVATRSAVLQVSPAHSGLTEDIERVPQQLMDRFVRLPSSRQQCRQLRSGQDPA